MVGIGWKGFAEAVIDALPAFKGNVNVLLQNEAVLGVWVRWLVSDDDSEALERPLQSLAQMGIEVDWKHADGKDQDLGIDWQRDGKDQDLKDRFGVLIIWGSDSDGSAYEEERWNALALRRGV